MDGLSDGPGDGVGIAHEIDERVVLDIWERQAFSPESLHAADVSVIFRGVPSDAGGPDYQDVLLSRGDEILSGDLEFHVRSSDWYRHGHHLDPSYNRVILHVVWEDDRSATLRQDGTPVHTLSVGRWPVFPVPPAQPLLAPHPCVQAFHRLSDTELEDRIAELALARFLERAERFARDMTALSSDQVVYAAIFEALGYASNRASFRALADAVSYGWVMSIPGDQRAAVLLHAAGLGPRAEIDPPGRLPPGSWRLSRLRPANHPVLRIRAVAALLDRHAPSIASSFVALVAGASPIPGLLQSLVVRQGDDVLIGTGRAHEIAVSAVLPCVAAHGCVDLARSAYLGFPAPPSNRWTRLMLRLLAEAGHSYAVKRAVQHQGLHALYLQHCRLESRSGCPVCGQPSRK